MSESVRDILLKAFDVIMKLHNEIDDRQSETGQSFLLYIDVNERTVRILFMGIVLWSTDEADDFSEESIEAEVREELGQLVEAVTKIQGVG